MSEHLQLGFGPCTRCPKVGRTDENGLRNQRDSTHYYCKQCRREYQRTRYVGPQVTVDLTTRVRTELDAILTLIRSEPEDPTVALAQVHDMVLKVTRMLIPVEEARGDDRRGPAKQTYEEMVRDYDLALEFGNADNARRKREEILEHFPERGLPGLPK